MSAKSNVEVVEQIYVRQAEPLLVEAVKRANVIGGSVSVAALLSVAAIGALQSIAVCLAALVDRTEHKS